MGGPVHGKQPAQQRHDVDAQTGCRRTGAAQRSRPGHLVAEEGQVDTQAAQPSGLHDLGLARVVLGGPEEQPLDAPEPWAVQRGEPAAQLGVHRRERLLAILQGAGGREVTREDVDRHDGRAQHRECSRREEPPAQRALRHDPSRRQRPLAGVC